MRCVTLLAMAGALTLTVAWVGRRELALAATASCKGLPDTFVPCNFAEAAARQIPVVEAWLSEGRQKLQSMLNDSVLSQAIPALTVLQASIQSHIAYVAEAVDHVSKLGRAQLEGCEKKLQQSLVDSALPEIVVSPLLSLIYGLQTSAQIAPVWSLLSFILLSLCVARGLRCRRKPSEHGTDEARLFELAFQSEVLGETPPTPRKGAFEAGPHSPVAGQNRVPVASPSRSSMSAKRRSGSPAVLEIKQAVKDESRTTPVVPASPVYDSCNSSKPDDKVSDEPPRAKVNTRRRVDSPAPPKVVETDESTEPSPQELQLLTILSLGGAEELQSLKGMGPKSVEAVLQYRQKGGTINKMDDLVNQVGLRRVQINQLLKNN